MLSSSIIVSSMVNLCKYRLWLLDSSGTFAKLHKLQPKFIILIKQSRKSYLNYQTQWSNILNFVENLDQNSSFYCFLNLFKIIVGVSLFCYTKSRVNMSHYIIVNMLILNKWYIYLRFRKINTIVFFYSFMRTYSLND
jgi:hypothetical protein